MASGILPKPGTKYGPCENAPDECTHRDCAATRATANDKCTFCKKPIGYETRFYDEDGGEHSHAVCAEEAIEEGQRKP